MKPSRASAATSETSLNTRSGCPWRTGDGVGGLVTGPVGVSVTAPPRPDPTAAGTLVAPGGTGPEVRGAQGSGFGGPRPGSPGRAYRRVPGARGPAAPEP